MSDKVKKPKDTAFRQQRLKAFIPVHTAKSSALIFFVASMVFLVFGILLYVECNNQTEFSTRYDNKCDISKSSSGNCQLKINVDKNLNEKVFVYYELRNFYQNYRLYVKSKSYTQLRGDSPTSRELSNCKYARYNEDFAGYYTGKKLKPKETARPCGLIARSVFNDTFEVVDHSIDSSDIVSDTDKKMFVSKDDSKEWTDMDNHFITWMKIAPLPTFRKLYGVIDNGLDKGKISVNVQNFYDVSEWDGEKWIVFSTNGKFGGKNTALGVVFIAAGVFCFLCSLVFTSAALFLKQRWMDQDPRSWRF